MSGLRFLCQFVLLFLFSHHACAHLISAGYGAINIQSGNSTLLIGVPVAVLKEVDLNGDGLLQPEEIKTGRLKIIAQLQTLIQLQIGGDAGTVIDDQLMVSVHLDKNNSTNQIEWLRYVHFPEAAMRQAVSVVMAPELAKSDFIIQVRRADDAETAVISSSHLKHTFLKGGWGTFMAFLDEGFMHILTGYDHVLFLLMLLSASVLFRRWLIVLTSFTLAHGVTYGLATFGILYVKPALIEPVIALTIVLAAVIHLLRWRPAISIEAAGVFSLGLFHGLGFASAMSGVSKELRFPIQSVAGFNLGVELGQITIACLLWGIFLWAKNKRFINLSAERIAHWIAWASAIIGAYWFIERVGF